jgi:hypothetical protein
MACAASIHHPLSPGLLIIARCPQSIRSQYAVRVMKSSEAEGAKPADSTETRPAIPRLSNLAPEFVNRNKNDRILSKQFNSREQRMRRM